MDQRTIQLLFILLRSAICGTKLNENEYAMYSEDLLPNLLKLAAKHDIIHLIALGLKQNELIFQENAKIEKHILNAVYRYERLRYEYEKICDVLEKAQIQFLPLKGAVMRKYYPDAWMRTSCDIDILVHEEDVEKTKTVLLEQCAYHYHGKGSHDFSFFTCSDIHIELHYSLIEESKAKEASTVLNTVWQYVAVRDGYKYWLEMTDEMFYFYHVAHMAKHFAEGGCGIRPIIDIWLLENLKDSNKEKRDSLLASGSLLKFANASRKLSRVWLGADEHDPVTKQMEEFILRGGVYGNSENRIIVEQLRKGGRIKYTLSKVFIPYEKIKFYYPVLQKHRWLTPIMQIRRWGKLIFCGHLNRVTHELQYSHNISNDEATSMQAFLNNIGL